MGIILEPRFLFDASVAPAAIKPVVDAASASADPAPSDRGGVEPAPSPDGAPGSTEPTHAREYGSAPPAGQAQGETQAQSSSAPPPGSVLFVDPRVSGWQALANSVSAATKVVVIDPGLDGIAQVTKALEGLRDVERVDFLTYGRPGQIEFGAGGIDSGTLHAKAGEVAGWRDHLADTAQIQFWGCDVGAGVVGNAFVSDLHALTGVAISASTNATGIEALGGDWTLERTAGAATPSVPFSMEVQGNFLTVLDAPVPTVTLSGLPGRILLGDSFTVTATFDNTALNGVGYGPFVDVFVPFNTLDKVTLNSASLLGQSLAVSSLTMSTSVTGHLGTLGALHPFVLDSTGAPTFVMAPTAAVEGDRLYVIEMPFGSFTADQTAIPIVLNLTVDKTSVLTNQHAGQLLNVEAMGGFIYGADALNNPGTDPSLRGTSGGTPADSTAANGLVTASATVGLINA